MAAHYGFGNHMGTVETEGNLSHALLYNWIAVSFVTLMIVWAQISVVALFFEVDKSLQQTQKWVLSSMVVMSLCVNVVKLFLIWFQCSPAKRLWELDLPGSCPRQTTYLDFSIFSGSWSAFVDLYLALYPIFISMKFHLPTRLTTMLLGVVGLAIFAAVCSCLRAYELHQVQKSTDSTWDRTPLLLWTAIEPWVLLIASSLPTLWPLVETHFNVQGSSDFLSKQTSNVRNKEGMDLEAMHSHRTSARSDATTATEATTLSDGSTTSTLNDSLAGQGLEGAISVKREVTVDRERRKSHHGSRPMTLSFSWARGDRRGSLARWSSVKSPKSPSWARAMR